MARCEICGGAQSGLELTLNGETQQFSCVKCAMQSLVSAMCPERWRHQRRRTAGARRIPLPHSLHTICPPAHVAWHAAAAHAPA